MSSAAPPTTPVDAPPPPPLCEVEIKGRVKVPRRAGKVPAPLVFVALGDCLAEAPRIVGHGGTTDGRLFVEVFVPWGSDLTLCAASEPSPGAPSTLYGKAPGGVHAAAYGEIEWEGVEVTLAPGPPRRFPHGAVQPAFGPP